VLQLINRDQALVSNSCTYIVAFYLRNADTIHFQMSFTGLTFVQGTVADYRIIRAAVFDRHGEGVLPWTEYKMGQEG
jgi:hypothetical protein